MVRPMQVRAAVIPAAGLGTRFLPATKAVPKELMPIGDTPAIQIIIDEALGAGIDHIVVVSSRTKPAIEQYFRPDPDPAAARKDKGKDDVAERVASIGRHPDVASGAPDPGQVRPPDGERVVVSVGDPDGRAVERQFDRERQTDRSRSGTEISDRPRRGRTIQQVEHRLHSGSRYSIHRIGTSDAARWRVHLR